MEKILAATRQDCTRKGIRDYAILMLISKYGIRSGEIATLRLDDVDWRKEVIRIRHSKTGAISYLPLLPEIGEAVLKYLQDSLAEDVFSRNIYSALVPRIDPSDAGQAYTDSPGIGSKPATSSLQANEAPMLFVTHGR